jgi:hypothetical protein
MPPRRRNVQMTAGSCGGEEPWRCKQTPGNHVENYLMETTVRHDDLLLLETVSDIDAVCAPTRIQPSARRGT